MKDENKQPKISESLGDAILELILTLVLAGIGFIVCLLIGKVFSFKVENIDGDLLILIGIAFIAIIVLVISAFIMLLKKIKKRNKELDADCCDSAEAQESK
jgi:membrane protein DedA with SNARE-associated domain